MNFNWPFSKTYQITCPDGTVRIIHKNIDDACPLTIKNWKAGVSADLKEEISQLNGKISGKYENEIKGFLFGLNDQNESLMMSFRAAYMGVQINPCENNGFFLRELEKLLENQQRLTELKMKISALIQLAINYPQETDRWQSIVNEIAARLGGSAIPIAASNAMIESKTEIQKLIQGT